MFTIGIDLGGTNIAVGVVDENMKIVAKSSTPTNMPRSAEAIVEDMAKLVVKVVADAKLTLDDIRWIGIGTPGTANIETGIVEYANNLGFDHTPLVALLKAKIDKPVFVENDANAAAYGEFRAGAAKNTKSAVIITLGTGVGGGVIIDSKIFRGSNYAGAELGHTVIEYNGRPCTCGRKGCFEAYASATGLANMTKESMEKNKDSKMWEVADGKLSNVNGKTAFDAWRLGDKAGSEVVDMYISYLACGLINVINTFQPEVLCLGGGICKEGDNLIKPLEKIINSQRYSKFSEKQTKLCRAQLGNDAGIIGAALIGEQA